MNAAAVDRSRPWRHCVRPRAVAGAAGVQDAAASVVQPGYGIENRPIANQLAPQTGYAAGSVKLSNRMPPAGSASDGDDPDDGQHRDK